MIFVYQQGTLVVDSFAGSYEALMVDGARLPAGKLTRYWIAPRQGATR